MSIARLPHRVTPPAPRHNHGSSIADTNTSPDTFFYHLHPLMIFTINCILTEVLLLASEYLSILLLFAFLRGWGSALANPQRPRVAGGEVMGNEQEI